MPASSLAPDPPRGTANRSSSPVLLPPPPKHTRQSSSSSSSSSRSDYSFGEDAERRVSMNRPRTGGIDFGQPLPSDLPQPAPPPPPPPPPPPKQQQPSGIPRGTSSPSGRSGAGQRKSSVQSWMDQSQSASAGGPRKPSWGTGAAAAGMWGPSATAAAGGAAPGVASARNASVSAGSGRTGAGMSHTGRQGSVASTGSNSISPRASTSQASPHRSRMSTSQHRDPQVRQQHERTPSSVSSAPPFQGNRMSNYSASSASGHPYAASSSSSSSSGGLLDPAQANNRFSRSSYTPGSGNKRFSTASAGSLNAPYAVYQPQLTAKKDSLKPDGALVGDSWEGGDSEGDPKSTSPSRTSEEETASLASFNTSEDDLLKQEALRRPSWVSIRLPSFASAATSRTNSTAGTITNGLSPKLDSSKSPPTSPRLEYEGSDAADFEQSMREVFHPPPTTRAQSSPTLPMSSSFARVGAKKPSPITTSAPFPSATAVISPRDSTSGPPVPPKSELLPTQRTLTDIAEMTRSTSASSATSTLPALPARSPLRARRGGPGSPTPSQMSFTSTNAPDSDYSSGEGGRASPADQRTGEFGQTDAGVDLSTVRARRSSRNRPKTADDTLVSARWSTATPPSRGTSQYVAADESAVWLDEDGEEKRRMSRTRPMSTASRTGLVGAHATDPSMRKKREARVISVEEEEAVKVASSDAEPAEKPYGGLGRSSNSTANGPIESTRSPSLPLHAATTVVPDLKLPQDPSGSLSQQAPPQPSPPRSPTGTLSAHHPTHQRSNSQPLPMLTGHAATSPAPITSKRAHLLHEISSTERLYATDLGLVRDAYLFRLRPTSQTESSNTTDGNTTQPTATSSNRSSMATYDTGRTSAEGTDDSRADRKSKMSNGSNDRVSLGNDSTGPSTSSLPGTGDEPAKSSAHSLAPSLGGISASPSSYFPPPSPRPVTLVSQNSFGSGNGSATPSLAQCPLSPADVRAVFLNLESVAALAHEFAMLLEQASSPASEDAGKDMIGEIFLTMMPRIRQAYTSYCPRQAGAHARFLELLVDRRYAGYFAECWTVVQPHTNSWDLPSMLIKPVQRVLKYPLLLEDLLKQTPASHPDYANLKRAAVTVRNLADEINEIKRRKDTVDSIMHKGRDTHGPAGGANLSKEKSRRGGVMTSFRKDRARGTSSSASAATAAGMSFTASSHEDLRKTETAYAALVSRLMTAETTAKRLGKAVASTGPKARESWLAQRKALDSWRRIINLGGIEPVEDIRIEAFRAVVEKVINGPCIAMERELQSEIVPAFIKLFAICKGPRTVILKRNANHEDYNRVIITKARGGDIEKLPQEVLEGAQVFVALHHQLLAELPPLLEGFATILDIVLKALAACHARFHRGVQDLLAGFWNEFPPVVMDVDSETAHISSDGPAIIRVWEEASRVPTEMVDDLAITRKITVRLMDAPVRLASGSANQIHEGIVDQRLNNGYAAAGSRSGGTSSRPSPGLARQPTTSSRQSALNSPLLSASRSTTKLELTGVDPRQQRQQQQYRPTSPNPPLERKSSARAIPQRQISNDVDRNSASSLASIGPALSQMSFEGSDASNHEHFAESVIRRLSYAQDGSTLNRLSSYEKDSALAAPRASVAKTDPRSPAQDRSFGGNGIETTPTKGAASVLPLIDASAEDDNDVEWDELGADAEVLYRCECVADFDLQGLDLQYMGHRFLKIARGDIVEILFEVGRVDELDDFPLDVGLEDDGLLIGKDGAGTQGFVLCSFLHPIFDEDEA